MSLGIKDREEIVACKGVFTSKELAQIFSVDRGQICRIWYNDYNGIVVRPNTTPSERRRLRLYSDPHYVSFPKSSSPLLAHQPEPLPPEPIVDTGKTILELEHADCRWIIGKDIDGEWRYCGCERGKDHHPQVRFYCREHAIAAFIDPLMVDRPVEIEERIASPANGEWNPPKRDDFVYEYDNLCVEVSRLESGKYVSFGSAKRNRDGSDR